MMKIDDVLNIYFHLWSDVFISKVNHGMVLFEHVNLKFCGKNNKEHIQLDKISP
jgi:hypothetical protein